MRRLESLGFLCKDENSWNKTSKNFSTSWDIIRFEFGCRDSDPSKFKGSTHRPSSREDLKETVPKKKRTKRAAQEKAIKGPREKLQILTQPTNTEPLNFLQIVPTAEAI